MKKIGVSILFTIVVALIAAFAWMQATWRRDFSSTPFPDIHASADPSVIARGEYVAQAVAHCSHCHSPDAPKIGDLSGGPAIDAGPFGHFYPSNLTPVGIGKLSDGELARAIRHAVDHDGTLAPMMLVGVAPMADEDLVAVISYLRSLPPKQNATPKDEWGLVAKLLSSKFQPRTASAPPYVPPGEISIERGKYLALGPALCASCHTARDPMKGFAVVGEVLTGEPHPHVDKVDPAFEIVAPNLTPDVSTGIIASWSEEQFVERFRRGRMFEGSIMPWESFQKLSDTDVRSLYRFLHSLQAVKHDVGPTRRPRQ
jgi:mono/diheme cytochrome c family protein